MSNTKVVVFIHWDEEHTSPPIGVFRTQKDAKLFQRDFRRNWKKVNDRRPVTGAPCPKMTMQFVKDPLEASHWV